MDALGAHRMSWWRFQAAVLLPLPVLLIAALALPLPRELRTRVIWFVEKVLGFEVRRPFEVIHFALLVTGEPRCIERGTGTTCAPLRFSVRGVALLCAPLCAVLCAELRSASSGRSC